MYLISIHGTIHLEAEAPKGSCNTRTTCGISTKSAWWVPYHEETYVAEHHEKRCRRCFKD